MRQIGSWNIFLSNVKVATSERRDFILSMADSVTDFQVVTTLINPAKADVQKLQDLRDSKKSASPSRIEEIESSESEEEGPHSDHRTEKEKEDVFSV